MLDRTVAPEFTQNLKLNLAPLQNFVLSNGIPIYSLVNPNLEVFRLEFIFSAGTYFGDILGQSFFTSKMLLSGTSKYDSNVLQKKFDFYGGYIGVNQNQERLIISLHGLTKYFDKYLPFLIEIIEDSVFPEAEMELHRKISLQNFKVEKEKTAFKSSSVFREILFGNTHTFGRILDATEIEKVGLVDVVQFYKAKIKNSAFKVFLAGNFSDKEIKLLNVTLSTLEITQTSNEDVALPELKPKQDFKETNDVNLQSSIRIGKRLFNRKHPDFYKFMVTNTVLGGYFGSRLMKNIREEKGLTYGINSSLVPMAGLGYFVIATDVKKENLDQALIEVNAEMDKLKNFLVSQDELVTVKNYISGAVVGSANSVFEVIDKHKAVIFENLNEGFYAEFLPNILNVSSEEILEMANTHLNDLSVVSVG